MRDDQTIMPLVQRTDSAAWSRLWKTGVLHSCASGISGNYDRQIASFWVDAFSHLRDGDTVIDLGTGNGALTLLARSYARANALDLDLHGIDIADIDPVRNLPDGRSVHAGTTFHPCTSMTALPFGDGAVALACAQFAFEYAPREEAAREVLRVIGDGGRAALIIHSAGSLIAETTDHQLQAGRWLLEEADVLHAAARLLNVMAGATSPDRRAALATNPAAEAARKAFNDAASTLMDEIAARPDAPILQAAAKRVSEHIRHTPNTRDEAMSMSIALRRWVEDEMQRLGSMQAACLDEYELLDLAKLLGGSGRKVTTGHLTYSENVPMGWTIVVGNE